MLDRSVSASMTDSSTTTSFESFARAPGAPIVRVVTPRLAETLDDISEREREFVIEARKVVRRKEKDREKAAERRERDHQNIESLASAILELGNLDPETLRDLPIAEVGDAAQVDVVQAKRLRRDAYWLARDHAETERLRGLNARTPAEELEFTKRQGETAHQRDVRIAYDALTSGTVKTRHLKPAQKHYSPRQAHLVREDCRREEYLRRMADQPRAQSHIIAGHDADGVVVMRHQSASDRFDLEGRGFVSEPGWVGGSSTQDNGGTCYQDRYVEKGKRSAGNFLDQRYLAATAKAPGKRRKGISNKKVIQRIAYLDGIGKTPEEIAADEKVDETVSRVKGALHALRYDSRHWAGDNNDRRQVHLKKWAALDQIHGNTRTDCREIIRVDVDRVFESWQEVEDHLNTLKVRPQKVNYVRDDQYPERATKPHYLYVLPEGSGVWYDESTGMAMLEAVVAALTIDAGGDIGGLANIHDVKQPTSPRVVSIAVETEHLPTLSELCKILDVDLKENLVVTMRQQSVAQMVAAGVSPTASGAFYSLAGKRGFELCSLWERTGELRIDANVDRRNLGVELFDHLLADRFMVDELSKLRASARDAAENSIRVAAKKVAESYGRGRRASSRGYDLRAAEAEVKKAVADVRATASADLTAAEIKKLEIHAAQSAGQVYCNRVQVQRSVRRIADAMLEISKVPDQKAVRELIGMDPRTIDRHWDAAVALNAANAIATVILDAPPTVPEPENQPDATHATIPAKCSGVRGVTRTDSREEQAGQPSEEPNKAIRATSGEMLTLETVIPATMLPLVNSLRPWDPASGETQTGRALLEFCLPGVRLYRSKLGIREQERRRLKGRAASSKSGQTNNLDDVDVWPEAVPA
ncbi:hypothetical protein M2171_002440 [Bradyrhizobium japonicum USDA 38]|uniref:hypothetical protein n=1 Tax=Bradyrhizobium japonicum TaxID=375 RepID=UPI00040DF5C8|nr:hypothetical protein [Bradyrhizobium japonicum]MCS3893307.1 hypothetical protein [Bradyrhizobium japonicum USDA 38]MCS3945821.1 hypothetical protein [Bradyrhizobium japonicum]